MTENLKVTIAIFQKDEEVFLDAIKELQQKHQCQISAMYNYSMSHEGELFQYYIITCHQTLQELFWLGRKMENFKNKTKAPDGRYL